MKGVLEGKASQVRQGGVKSGKVESGQVKVGLGKAIVLYY